MTLIPGKPLDARLRRMAKDHPGLPGGVSQVVADLNARSDGVAATVDEPRENGDDRSLLLYTRDYRVRLFRTRRGDAFTVAGIDPIRLKDHDRLAQGCLRLRARWHAVLEPRQVPQGSDAQWPALLSAWTRLLRTRGDEQAVPTVSAAQAAFLDTLDHLIDTKREMEAAADVPSYPYREVRTTGERRYSASSMYEFLVVGGRVPERGQFVGLRGEPAQRGQVLRADEERVVVRFDQPIDWAGLPQQGELEETRSNVVHAKQREAVGLLRDRRSRNHSLLTVLVDHQVKPLATSPENPGEELDDDQLVAFRRALGVRDMLVVLGPPGTGKTRTISEIARARALAPERAPVLVASHTNRAVDNVLAKLSKDVVVVRVGNEGKVDPDGRPFLLERLASDLRGEVLSTVDVALRSYEGVPIAASWLPELERRTSAYGAALDAEARAAAELDRVRRVMGGPAQTRVEECRSELAVHEQRMVRARRKLERLGGRDARARNRRWWPPLDRWAASRARGRARRMQAEQATLAGLAEAAVGLRASVFQAGEALDVATRGIPQVQHAHRELERIRHHRQAAASSTAEAAEAIRRALGGVEVIPPIPAGLDAGEAWRMSTRLHAWAGPRLVLLGAREKLLSEWREEVSGKTEQLHPELIRYADVIGATCVGAATRSEIAEVEFDLAIIDEAGQIDTANLLVPLVRAKRSVLVGDHRQLPPFLDSDVQRWGEENGDPLIRDLLEKSGLEILVGAIPDSHIVRLTQQRRMPKVIADFVSDMFYEGTLRTKVVREHNSPLFSSPLAFVDTFRLPERKRMETPAQQWNPSLSGGWVNHAEARMLARLAAHYQRSGVEWALIVPYSAQVKLISNLLRLGGVASDTIDGSIGTVDSFQGGERDVILYGFTRSNSRGEVGFLDELRRANVAFTRAKRQLVLIGDMGMLLRAKDLGFRALSTSLRDHVAASGDVQQYEEFETRLEGLE
ncbi:DEAD/DEAH box helicase [Amycolatopsis pittospori]|uniref:DEAD/DEAH box helicase n=1 Tax=Amycolatopsis pittospori TaxID=2749434 RepID=UPI0015F0A618|nr:ATP-binding protein [Amycolatopsis pittospori]